MDESRMATCQSAVPIDSRPQKTVHSQCSLSWDTARGDQKRLWELRFFLLERFYENYCCQLEISLPITWWANKWTVSWEKRDNTFYFNTPYMMGTHVSVSAGATSHVITQKTNLQNALQLWLSLIRARGLILPSHSNFKKCLDAVCDN